MKHAKQIIHFLFWALATTMLVTILSVGCGEKKKNKAKINPGNNTILPCTGACIGNTSLGSKLNSAVGSFPTQSTGGGYYGLSSTMLQLGLDFYAQNTSTVNIVNSYSGPVLATGYLWLQNFQAYSYCQFPDGEYTVTTVTPGQSQPPVYYASQISLVARNGNHTINMRLNNVSMGPFNSTGLNSNHSAFSNGFIAYLTLESNGCSDQVLLSY